MRKLFALIGIVVVALALAVGAKTALTPSRQLQVVSVQPATVAVSAAFGCCAGPGSIVMSVACHDQWTENSAAQASEWLVSSRYVNGDQQSHPTLY